MTNAGTFLGIVRRAAAPDPPRRRALGVTLGGMWTRHLFVLLPGLLRLALMALLVVGAGACGLFISLDEYDTSAPLFAVRGTVDGLKGARATLRLNGLAMEVPDGPFRLDDALAEGAPYVLAVPSPPGHTCTIDGGGIGTVASADVTGVAIHCPSDEASLVSLSLSAGTLSPAFQPGNLAYTVTTPRCSSRPPRRP